MRKLNIIVVGCGRVGSNLAIELAQAAHNVNVIDQKDKCFNNLGQNFNGNTVHGLGHEEETLEHADIEMCDVLCAVTQNDNTNLMIAEIASRIYDVRHVIARLYNTNHERAYERLGIDYVCGTTLVSNEMFDKINSGYMGHFGDFDDFEILKFSLDLRKIRLDEITVAQLNLEHHISIIAYEKADGTYSAITYPYTTLHHGDIVLACVRKDHVEDFSLYIQGG